MTKLNTSGRRRVLGVVAVIGVLAMACGGTPAAVNVLFRKSGYFDGTRSHEVVAIQDGRVTADISLPEDTGIDLTTIDAETVELGVLSERIDGTVVAASATAATLSFPLTAAVQDPASTEPAQAQLCVFFNAVDADGGDVEASGCEDVLVPPANRRPQPAPGGGSPSPAPPPSPSSHWKNITATVGTAPSDRIAPAMAELPNGDVLLFGGGEQGAPGAPPTLMDDTWRFNGTTWTRLSPVTVPAARMDAAMAFDGTDVILFGGSGTAGLRDDTWRWDDTAGNWVEVTNPGGVPWPSAREGAAMASKGAGATIDGAVMYGGSTAGGTSSETWAWDAATDTWSDRTNPADNPGPLTQASMAYDRLRSRVVLQGGAPSAGDPPEEETYELDPATYDWQDVTGGEAGTRSFAAMAASDVDEPLFLYGGYDGAALTDRTDQWSGAQWIPVTTPGNPPARSAHGMATFSHGSSFALMFGGHLQGGAFVSETWIYDPTP